MGCCPSYPRFQLIDVADNVDQLINAVKEFQKNSDDESRNIQKFLENKESLNYDYLKQFTSEDLKKRIGYLNELHESADEIINSLSLCSNKLPLSMAKDNIQVWVGNFYVCYDFSKKYKRDENQFKQFASNYYMSNPKK